MTTPFVSVAALTLLVLAAGAGMGMADPLDDYVLFDELDATSPLILNDNAETIDSVALHGGSRVYHLGCSEPRCCGGSCGINIGCIGYTYSNVTTPKCTINQAGGFSLQTDVQQTAAIAGMPYSPISWPFNSLELLLAQCETSRCSAFSTNDGMMTRYGMNGSVATYISKLSCGTYGPMTVHQPSCIGAGANNRGESPTTVLVCQGNIPARATLQLTQRVSGSGIADLLATCSKTAACMGVIQLDQIESPGQGWMLQLTPMHGTVLGALNQGIVGFMAWPQYRRRWV